MRALCDAALAKQCDEAMRLHKLLLPLHKNLFVESNPIPVKWAMQRMGLCAGNLRLPLTELSAPWHGVLENALKTAGLL